MASKSKQIIASKLFIQFDCHRWSNTKVHLQNCTFQSFSENLMASNLQSLLNYNTITNQLFHK